MPDDNFAPTKADAPAPSLKTEMYVIAADELIDKWWSDHVAALQSNDWAAKVDAKEDLKKRVASILNK